MSDLKVRLYVKSAKKVMGTREIERETLLRAPFSRTDRVKIEGKVTSGTYRLRAFETETEPVYEFVLPTEQQSILEMVREIASKNGIEVELVDVTRENVLHRAIDEELRRIRSFPTLTLSSGERIEGPMTRKQVESIFSRAH